MRIALALAVAALSVSAAAARGAGASGTLGVSVRVIRSAAFSVPDAPQEGGRFVARAIRGAPQAGFAVATEREWASASVPVLPLAEPARLPRAGAERVVVTLIPDGRPTSVRFAN